MMNILIIGLGSIAKKQIEAINVVFPDAKIYALRSKKSEIKSEITEFENYKEINIILNLIIISNPTFKHYETIEKCLDYNCPILIEKPALSSLNKSEELLQKIEKHNIKTYIACNLRFHPCIEYLKKYFTYNSHKVNEVNIYCGSYLPNWRVNTDFRANYSANAAMGGGVHLDLIHEIDYCTWIFGLPNESISFKESNSSLKIVAIDYAHYVLKYPDFVATITLNYFRILPKREIEIVFENDIWKVDLQTSKITNAKNEIVFEDNKFQIIQTYIKQMAYLKECLEKNEPCMNDFSEALNVLKICCDE